MDKRLLDAAEIEAVWKQFSINPLMMEQLSGVMFRFAVEIAMAQLAKVNSMSDDKRRPWFEQEGTSNTYIGKGNRSIP